MSTETLHPMEVLSTNRFVTVSTRNYQRVRGHLWLPDSYLAFGTDILLPGEGLSNFGRVLKERYDVRVTCVDPIYELGEVVFQDSPNAVAEALRKAYGSRVIFSTYGDDPEVVYLPDPTTVRAGSVYDLGEFHPSTFDLILAHRLVEHIDLSRALPELVRILKPNGEIRLAGILMTAVAPEDKLLEGYFERTDDDEWELVPPPGKVRESLDWIRNQQGLSVYTLVDGHRELKVFSDKRLDSAGVLIIRKDAIWPNVQSPLEQKEYRREELGVRVSDENPNLGQVFKINPTLTRGGSFGWIDSYYPLLREERGLAA